MQKDFFQPVTYLLQQLKTGVQQLNPEHLIQPPLWMQHAVQVRLVLILNHVLQQEAHAVERLLLHQGKTLQVQWRKFSLCLRITSAGLVALEDSILSPHLTVQMGDTNPLKIMHQTALGQRPNIHISGDAELASNIHWLAENVRWNMQDDLAYLLGEETAKYIAQFARIVHDALTEFIRTVSGNSGTSKQKKLPHRSNEQP